MITKYVNNNTPLQTLETAFDSVKQCNLILYDADSGYDKIYGHVAMVVGVDSTTKMVTIME